MTRLAFGKIALITLLGTFAFAQDSIPKVQVFGGYSLEHADLGGLKAAVLDVDLLQHNGPFATTNNFNGWSAEAQYNANHWLGVVADFGGRYGSAIISASNLTLDGLPKGTGYSFLVGPVASFRGKTKFTPFIHALFGFDRISLSGSTITGGTSPIPALATTYTDAAVMLGGGVDFKVSRHFSIRLAQLDEFYTTHNLNDFYNNVFDTQLFHGLPTHEHNLRVSSGVVVRF
jgi:hypothetical protein